MITNPSDLEKLLVSFQRDESLSLEKRFALLNSMYRLAVLFGHFTPERTLEGIDHDINLAAWLNSVVRTTSR